MSQGNVERLRAAYEAFNRGDFDAAVKIVRPDATFVRPGLEGPLRGVAAVREWMEPDAFEEQQVEPLGFEASGDRVLMRQRTTARGAGSGIELDVETWAVFTFDDGFIVRGEVFPREQESQARQAARL